MAKHALTRLLLLASAVLGGVYGPPGMEYEEEGGEGEDRGVKEKSPEDLARMKKAEEKRQRKRKS